METTQIYSWLKYLKSSKNFQKLDILETKYKLIYFNIPGLAEPIRWMFRISNVDFDEERIDLDKWREQKYRFGKPVGQLPILCIDNNRVLTQVDSIMRHVAKQLGFDGQSEMETARADQVVEMLNELRLHAVSHKNCFTIPNPDIVRHTFFYDFKNEESLSKKVIIRKHLLQDTFPMYLNKFAEFLEDSGGEYIAGPNITYADLALANFLDDCEDAINPDVLYDYPTLKGLKEEILEIPEIASYIAETRVSPAPAA